MHCTRLRCSCISCTNPSEEVVRLSLDGFPYSFCYRSVWIHKFVAVRVVVLDTAGQWLRTVGMWLVLRPGKKGRPKGLHRPPMIVFLKAKTSGLVESGD